MPLKYSKQLKEVATGLLTLILPKTIIALATTLVWKETNENIKINIVLCLQ